MAEANNNNKEMKESNGQQPPQETGPSVESDGEMETPQLVNMTAEELEKLKKECLESKDKYLRVLAEMENMRKRLQKERLDLVQHAIQNVMVEFLNPIDHMENALKFAQEMSDEVKHWALGFQMILNQFKDVLSNHGVVAFSSVGMPFDPNRHEAIEMIVTNEYSPGTVVSESVKGYKMGDRIIRPARVTVAKASEEESKENNKK
jgi:molecular chaperone GrpE